MSSPTILSIETSCDETAIAITKTSNGKIFALSSLVSSQIALHAEWGGVVPNLAAREHVRNITPLLEKSFAIARIKPEDIDAIAVTQGPGLIPALLIGVDFAKTLSYLWKKPLLGIHHIEGHIYANFICSSQKQDAEIQFPTIALVVSGGHTQLVLMQDHLRYEIIGQTLDDAVGEAFDKVARILNIGYPGGPAVAARADKHNIWSMEHRTNQENSYTIKLPRPMLTKKNFDFSFSGLKTAVLYETKKNSKILNDETYINAVCHEFQQACVDVLVAKTIKAAEKFEPKTIMLAGGVSANTELRIQLGKAIEKFLPVTDYRLPVTELTGDNAAMIGAAAHFRWEKMNKKEKENTKDNWKNMQASANLELN